MKPKIKEVIVVEGKDDVSALRKAVEADILITTGLGLTVAKIEEIKKLAERRGVIVFTANMHISQKKRAAAPKRESWAWSMRLRRRSCVLCARQRRSSSNMKSFMI